MAEFETLFISGDRASQPAAAAADQKFYMVTDEDNIVERSDGVAWTQWGPSAPSSGGGLVLIEHKLIDSDAQNHNFAGLDGNTDGMYHLIVEAINGAATSLYTIKPNSLTTNLVEARTNGSGSAVVAATTTTWEIGFAIATHYNHVVADIYARCNPNSVARPRFYTATYAGVGTGPLVNQGTYGGRWLETSTNITSLLVGGDQADSLKSGSELFLYKYAQ